MSFGNPMDDIMGNKVTQHVDSDSGEISSVDSDDAEVIVEEVDDRPEEDQRAPRDSSRSKGQDFDPDEEIADVSGRAGKRIKKLRYEYHEQRREKEAAERMKEEAVNYAQQMAHQNGQLRDLLNRGENVLLSEIKARTESELSKARDQYKTAYSDGDADAVVKAQEALTRSTYDSRVAESYQPLSQEEVMYQQQQQQPPPPQPQIQQAPPDPKLKEWLSENEWFGKDAEKTSFAYGVHEKLVREEGMDPRSAEYYKAIDKRMGQVFPDGKNKTRSNETNVVEVVEQHPARRTSTVVSPARRSAGGSPRKVQLTSTQVALAKRLGLRPEQYAKQLLKESGNG